MECQPAHTTQQQGDMPTGAYHPTAGRNANRRIPPNTKPRIPPNTALKLSATSLQDRLVYVIIIAKAMEYHRLRS